ARRDLLEQFQPFRAKAELSRHKAGGVATRSREARHKAGADRVDDIREHDRRGASRLLQRFDRAASGSYQDVRLQPGQFSRGSAEAVGIAQTPANIDADVAAVGPA